MTRDRVQRTEDQMTSVEALAADLGVSTAGMIRQSLAALRESGDAAQKARLERSLTALSRFRAVSIPHDGLSDDEPEPRA